MDTMPVVEVRQIYIFIHTWLVWTISGTAASSCTDDQVSRCKGAAVQQGMESLPEGGLCQPSKYVNYTHQCGILSYLPSADFCCCTFEARVFCCRYHYDWNYYRCNENEDTIHHMSGLSLPVDIVLPAIVLPSVAVLCIIFYCVKCCCCNDDDDDDDSGGCCYIKCGCRKKRIHEKSSRRDSRNKAASVNQHFTRLPTINKDITRVVVPEQCDLLFAHKLSVDNGPGKQPTAPPYVMTDMDPPPYNPGLYNPHGLDTNRNQSQSPYTSSYNGSNMTYKPILTEAEISLPITKLLEQDCKLQDTKIEQDTTLNTQDGRIVT